MGRPPIELDEARRRRLVAALEAGATFELAARAAGVSAATLKRWRDDDDELAQAEARGAVRALEVIQAAAAGPHAGQWQAAAWLLERRYPDSYGRRPPRVEDGRELETVIGWLNAAQARAVRLMQGAPGDDAPLPAPPELLQRAEQAIAEAAPPPAPSPRRDGLSFA